MNRQTLLWLTLGGAVAYYLYVNQQQLILDAQDAGDSIMSDIVGWKAVNDGPIWVPVLNATEQQLGIPPDLLARLAYQESSFRTGVINGTTKSSAGALGIMQMMPQYFSTVNAPIPFSTADIEAQIQQGAQNLVSQYETFGSWQLALAAYNAGAGAVKQYGGIPPFPETQNYVADITADVPAIANA